MCHFAGRTLLETGLLHRVILVENQFSTLLTSLLLLHIKLLLLTGSQLFPLTLFTVCQAYTNSSVLQLVIRNIVQLSLHTVGNAFYEENIFCALWGVLQCIHDAL